MQKAKILMPAFALAMMLGLASTAFAQISCNIASTPVSRATSTGHTEPVGDITFLCTGGANATTAATATIELGVVITNNTAHPAGGPIGITNTAGDFDGGAVTISSVSNTTGQIVVNLPAVAAPAASSSFTLSGVLVSLNGTGLSNLQANVSVSPGNNYFVTAGQNVATVITTIQPGLGAPVIHTPTGGTATIFTNRVVPDAIFSIRIPEGYIDALRDDAQFNGGNTHPAGQGVDVLLTFTGIPTGVSLGTNATPCVPSVPLPDATAATVTSSNNVLTPTANTTVLSIADADLTALHTLQFRCSAIGVPGSGLIPAGQITVQATLAPTGNALSATSTVLTSATAGQVPRYANTPLPTPPLVVVNIVPATTNLLMPLAMVTGGFDTGLGISNTSMDPYGTAAGGAVGVSGTITFHFFRHDGQTASYTTTAGSPGNGLTAGSLSAGGTYVVNISELLAQTSLTGNFIGYVFIVADFTHGHGTAFMVDWSGATNFASATNLLVLPPPALQSRAITGAPFVESLGF